MTPLLGAVPRWWYCVTHGPGSHSSWGCPECVREMRAEIKALQSLVLDYAAACGELSKGLLPDDPMWSELKALGDRIDAKSNTP